MKLNKNDESFRKQLEETIMKNRDNKLLQSMLKNPQVQSAFKNLSSEDITKIQSVLNNPKQAKAILATDEAKNKINEFTKSK